jgi:hypothetical protein
MKIEKFFYWIQNQLINYPDIHLKTVKIFVDKFYCCLSKKEKERFRLHYQIISEISLKQISLDSFLLDSKINQLENKLTEIKKENL